jgi:hypothetical protein
VPRGVRRFSLLSVVAVCAVLGGAVAVAQASDDTIKQTVNSFAPKIVKDENAVKTGLNEYPQGKAKPLTHALQHEDGDLRALISQLSHESASSASVAQAKHEIINGLGLIASAYAALRRDILAVHGGPVPGAQVTAAVNRDKQGRKKLQAGLNLLDAQPAPNPTPTPTPSPAPAGCYPLTSSGSCYEPGEYCPAADYGASGVAGDGESITCEDNNGWRWEPSTTTPAPTPNPTGCYPLTDSGGCYEPGEYCRNSDHGMTGVAGDGESITCEDNNGWRWEPA